MDAASTLHMMMTDAEGRLAAIDRTAAATEARVAIDCGICPRTRDCGTCLHRELITLLRMQQCNATRELQAVKETWRNFLKGNIK